MNQFNLYSIPPLICGILTLCVGLFVFTKNTKSKVNITFFLFSLSAAIWLLFYGINYALSFTSINPEIIYWNYRIAYCGVFFIFIFFIHCLAIFYKFKTFNKLIILNYIVGFLASGLLLSTDYIIVGLHKYFWGYYPKAGLLHPLFLSYFNVSST